MVQRIKIIREKLKGIHLQLSHFIDETETQSSGFQADRERGGPSAWKHLLGTNCWGRKTSPTLLGSFGWSNN